MSNYHVKAADKAEGVQVFVVVGKGALEVWVLLVEHLLRGCQLNRQRAHLLHRVVFVAQRTRHLILL